MSQTEEIKQMLADIRTATLIGVKEMLTIAEAAMYLNISESTLVAKLKMHELPCYKPAGQLYLKKTELDAWMSNPDKKKKSIIETLEDFYNGSK